MHFEKKNKRFMELSLSPTFNLCYKENTSSQSWLTHLGNRHIYHPVLLWRRSNKDVKTSNRRKCRHACWIGIHRYSTNHRMCKDLVASLTDLSRACTVNHFILKTHLHHITQVQKLCTSNAAILSNLLTLYSNWSICQHGDIYYIFLLV